MASPRFDRNCILIANRLHDPRTAVSGDPLESSMRYPIALLVKYQNFAIRDVIRDLYKQYGPKNFDKIMPEMQSESGDITLASGLGDFSVSQPDCWIVLEVSKNDYSWYATRIDMDTLKVKAGRDPMLTPSLTHPVFYQLGTKIQVLPTGITGPAHMWYIQQPVDMTVANSTDIPYSPAWDTEIIERAVAMGVSDAKSAIAL